MNMYTLSGKGSLWNYTLETNLNILIPLNQSDVLLVVVDVVDDIYLHSTPTIDGLVTMSDYAHVPGGSLKFKGAGEKYV
jgi:hypothetical protein